MKAKLLLLAMLVTLFAIPAVLSADNATVTLTLKSSLTNSSGTGVLDFNCTTIITSGGETKNIFNVSLFTDWSGSSIRNDTNSSAVTNNTAYNFSRPTAGIGDGTYNIYCRTMIENSTGAAGNYENYTSSTSSFEVDRTSPAISSYSPSKKAGSSVEVIIKTNDPNSVCSYSKTDESWGTMSLGFGTANAQGNIYKTLEFYDKGGNKPNNWYICCQDDHFNNCTTRTKVTVNHVSAVVPVTESGEIAVQTTTSRKARGISTSSLAWVAIIFVVMIIGIAILVTRNSKR